MAQNFEPIGIIHTGFKQKFGIPRQGNLAPDAKGVLELLPPYNQPEAVRGLESFSHLWLLFLFHGNNSQASGGWKPTVRPPRLGGNQRLGVFATRSPFRPNPIGLSVVKLEAISREKGQVRLFLAGVDLLDGTPVLDIKPYLPYADSIPAARGGFAATRPEIQFQVTFTPQAAAQIETLEETGYPQLQALIIQMLQIDPRPAYYTQNRKRTSFGFQLYDFEVKWQVVEEDSIVVTALVRLGANPSAVF